METPDLDRDAIGVDDIEVRPPTAHTDMDDAAAFHHDRKENDRRLKSRFEAIFEKYARDFSGVGDEIDIETGEIVVDNGHLESMQHEVDPGESQSLRFVKDFAEELECEDEDSVSGDDEEAVGEDKEALDGREVVEDEVVEGDEAEVPFALESKLQELNDTDMTGGPEATLDAEQVLSALPPTALSNPAVRASMRDMILKAENSQQMDLEAIEALGVSIASQLAKKFNMPKTRSKTKRKESIWDFPDLPAFKRQRTAEVQTPRPLLTNLSTVLSPAAKADVEPAESIWAPPNRPRSQARRSRPLSHANRVSSGLEEAESLVSKLTPVLKECTHCHIKATPTWRRGANGEDLCNACGMYWSRYQLPRPLKANSPEEGEVRDEPEYAANTSRPLAKTGARHTQFAVTEDALLIKLKEIDRLPWEKIGRHFSGRSIYGVQCRYAKNLLSQDSEGRDALIEQGFTFDKTDGAGDEEPDEQQDELLVQLRLENELDWSAIAEKISGRSAEWLEERYDLLVGNGGEKRKTKPIPNPIGHVNTPKNHYRTYTPAEDELLIKLREVDKLPWEILAQEFTQRTWLSLQKRYVRTLAQRHKVMREGGDDPYMHLFLQADDNEDNEEVVLGPAGRRRMESMLVQRKEEDALLLRLRDEQALGFGEIAERMPGRTVASLKNRHEYLKKMDTSMDVPTPTSPDDEGQQDGVASLKAAYSSSEDEIILRLRDVENSDWSDIAARLPGRTGPAVERRYGELSERQEAHGGDTVDIEDANVVAVEAQVEAPMSIDPQLLQDITEDTKQAVESSVVGVSDLMQPGATGFAQTGQMPRLAKSLEPRTPVSSLLQDQAILSSATLTVQASARSSGPVRSRARWTQVETEALSSLRSEGMDWDEISERLPGRTPAAVMSRWTEHCKKVATVVPSNSEHSTPLSSNALVKHAERHGSEPALSPDAKAVVRDDDSGSECLSTPPSSPLLEATAMELTESEAEFKSFALKHDTARISTPATQHKVDSASSDSRPAIDSARNSVELQCPSGVVTSPSLSAGNNPTTHCTTVASQSSTTLDSNDSPQGGSSASRLPASPPTPLMPDPPATPSGERWRKWKNRNHPGTGAEHESTFSGVVAAVPSSTPIVAVSASTYNHVSSPALLLYHQSTDPFIEHSLTKPFPPTRNITHGLAFDAVLDSQGLNMPTEILVDKRRRLDDALRDVDGNMSEGVPSNAAQSMSLLLGLPSSSCAMPLDAGEEVDSRGTSATADTMQTSDTTNSSIDDFAAIITSTPTTSSDPLQSMLAFENAKGARSPAMPSTDPLQHNEHSYGEPKNNIAGAPVASGKRKPSLSRDTVQSVKSSSLKRQRQSRAVSKVPVSSGNNKVAGKDQDVTTSASVSSILQTARIKAPPGRTTRNSLETSTRTPPLAELRQQRDSRAANPRPTSGSATPKASMRGGGSSVRRNVQVMAEAYDSSEDELAL
ncbi:hypothetical protein LTR56_002584 [Elasticomyces elasticus]|nr:hypothetical protein LTR22_013486 [Elasticomyces elasticus]KAK3657070.1 hypothetical protein LTR56_002584 [Elasticomyces elasticus]KAK4926701.1 hypothetical protein LTR49_006383 [Elasticomyces elasticus]KAK5762348.1 hypothetical protein LTS12_007507 [Elasticomyces elasticus]